MTAVELAAHRKPTYSPKSQRHSWTDVDGGHECGFCGVVYRSLQDPDSGVWWKAWSWRGKAGRCLKMPPCPGPDAGPDADAEAVEPSPAPLTVAAAPVEAASTPPCCRCVPPLEPCNQPTHLYLAGYLCDFQAGLPSARTTNGGVS
jgi:hypothetical protein